MPRRALVLEVWNEFCGEGIHRFTPEQRQILRPIFYAGLSSIFRILNNAGMNPKSLPRDLANILRQIADEVRDCSEAEKEQIQAALDARER